MKVNKYRMSRMAGMARLLERRCYYVQYGSVRLFLHLCLLCLSGPLPLPPHLHPPLHPHLHPTSSDQKYAFATDCETLVTYDDRTDRVHI